MHQSKINLQSALNQSEVGKRSPDWIKIHYHCRHTAMVVVSAINLLGEQKQNRKTVH